MSDPIEIKPDRSELEQRLRSIAMPSAPDAPAALREAMARIPAEHRHLGRPQRLAGTAVHRAKMLILGRERLAAAVSAAVLVAMVGGLALASSAAPPPAATATPSVLAAVSPTEQGETPNPYATQDEIWSPQPWPDESPDGSPYDPYDSDSSGHDHGTVTCEAVPAPRATEVPSPSPTPTFSPSPTPTLSGDTPAPSPSGTPAPTPAASESGAVPVGFGADTLMSRPHTRASIAPAAAAGSFRWEAGGEARINSDILAVPSGYLATLYFEEANEYAFCFSPDLREWRTPTSRQFVNQGSGVFYPMTLIPVTKGYAVTSQDPFQPCDINACDIQTTEWYSADGLHWRLGVPSSVRVATWQPPCDSGQEDSCWWRYGAGLVLSEKRENNVTTVMVSKDRGLTWSTAKLPPHVREVVRIDRPKDGLYVAVAADWTMIDNYTGPGVIGMGPDQDTIITSTDGITWSKAQVTGADILAVGGAIYAVDREALWQSTDGARTWVQITNEGGEEIGGQGLAIAGNKLLLCDARPSEYPYSIYYVGTPG